MTQLLGLADHGRALRRSKGHIQMGKRGEGGQMREGVDGEGGMVEHGGGRGRRASGGYGWGKFSDEDTLLAELISFQKKHSNNEREVARVLPSSGQLRRAGRGDLVRAIDRYGGEDALSRRFNMLSSRSAPSTPHSTT